MVVGKCKMVMLQPKIKKPCMRNNIYSLYTNAVIKNRLYTLYTCGKSNLSINNICSNYNRQYKEYTILLGGGVLL